MDTSSDEVEAILVDEHQAAKPSWGAKRLVAIPAGLLLLFAGVVMARSATTPHAQGSMKHSMSKATIYTGSVAWRTSHGKDVFVIKDDYTITEYCHGVFDKIEGPTELLDDLGLVRASSKYNENAYVALAWMKGSAKSMDKYKYAYALECLRDLTYRTTDANKAWGYTTAKDHESIYYPVNVQGDKVTVYVWKLIYSKREEAEEAAEKDLEEAQDAQEDEGEEEQDHSDQDEEAQKEAQEEEQEEKREEETGCKPKDMVPKKVKVGYCKSDRVGLGKDTVHGKGMESLKACGLASLEDSRCAKGGFFDAIKLGDTVQCKCPTGTCVDDTNPTAESWTIYEFSDCDA